jgi:rsbT antagonist protein RsbS
MELQAAINTRIEKTNAAGLLIDISALQTVDSFLGRLLSEIAAGARLLGAETVIAGMQPAVAITLVELGLGLRGVRTALDAEQGLHYLQTGSGRRL